MIEVLLLVCAASVFAFGSVTLVVATFALRAARRYVKLAEERMELLRQGQACLLSLPVDGHRIAREGAALERQLKELREARRRIPLPAAAGTSEAHRRSRGLERRGREDRVTPPTGFPETSAVRKKPLADGGPPREGRPPLGVRHPHPDDGADLSARAPSSGPARARSGASVDMFRKHYDKYLENYQGYVELAERLYRSRDAAGTKPGSSEERDREERLRRLNDGMARTIGRLDILEEFNPELAADDRVSRRALVARRHTELGGEVGAAGRP